ncbi:MAG: translation elongation factor Ts [Intestinimonas sp.]|nr:translation elongation factor Ts [Intestinimonas sp.]
MAFTAKDVQTLREITGCGMLDCKKALTESAGDMDKAVEVLREKGLAASQKKAGRISAEGAAYAAVENGVGAIVEVNAETDFVGKNEKFIEFVKGVAQIVIKSNPSSLEDLMAKPYLDTGRTVLEEQQEKVLVIGENIKVRRFARYDTGVTVAYVHMGGRIGVLVNMEVSDNLKDSAAVTELGKDVAMQIAAMNPKYLDSTSVPAEEQEKEHEIQLAKAIEENKAKKMPEEKAKMIAANMVKGRMNKFFEEICLVNQPYVKENKLTVEQHVKNVAKELGGTIVLKGFVRFEKGEGIEKKQENFAEEIAKQLKK